MDGGEIVPGQLVIAGRNSAEVLEATDRALDLVAISIDLAVEGMAALAGRVVGDHRQTAALDEKAAQAVAVVSRIRQAQRRRRQVTDEGQRHPRIAALAGAQLEGDRPPLLIDRCVDLSGVSAARAPDGLRVRPPFPPPAQRWALA